MTQISNKDIADAILSFASGKIDVFLDLLRKESYKRKSSLWHELCRNILPLGTCHRTVNKHVRKCYYRFQRCRNDIKYLIDERLTNNNVQDAVADSCLNMEICHDVIDELQYVEEPPRSASNLSLSTDMISDCTVQCPTDDILINEHNSKIEVDSTKKETQKSIQTNWQEGNQIVLPRNFFELFWSGGKTLLKGWTDAFNDEFKIQYPKCVLAFKDHECFAESTRTNDNISFQARATCKHQHCTKYKFFIIGNISEPYTNKPVHVFLEKEIQHHKGDVHRRHVRYQKRSTFAEDLEKHLPLYVKYKCLNKACIESLEAGNCT